MSRMNRRRFVAVTSVTATSVLLVACGNEKLSEEELNPTQIPDVPGAPPTIAPLTSTPGAAADEPAGDTGDTGGGSEAVAIEAHDDFSFSPSEVEVAPGQTVTLTNAGFAQHDLYVEDWDLGTELLNGGDSGEIVIPEDAEVGSTHTFYCTVPGHRESGMEGTFTIVEAGAAAPAGEEGAGEEATSEEGAAAGGSEAIAIEAHDDFSFNPSEVDVAPGQTVTLTNMGFAQHDLYVEDWDLGTELLNNGQSGEIVIPEDAEVGSTHVFYCTVVGHRQSGMEGTFTIVEAGAAAAPAGEGEGEAEATAEEATSEEGAAAGGSEPITIEAHDDFSFSPNEVEVAPGQTVTLTNAGFAQHDLYVEEWDLGTELLNNGQSGEIVIPEDAEVGAQFVFYCTVVGHRQSGMEGTFTIVEAGAAAAPAGEGEGEAEATAEEATSEEGAAASGSEPITIEANDDFSFNPSEVDVAPGQTVTLTNMGFAQHDLYVDEWELGTELLNNGQSGEIVIPEDAEVGAQFVFYCTVVGHRQSGMEGTFTIVEAGAAAAPAGEGVGEAEATAEEEAGAAEGSGSAGEAITIEANDDFSFNPSEVDVAPGQTVTLTNMGFAQHDLYVDEWELGTELLNNGQSGEIVIPEDAEVGAQFVFYCTVVGHRQSGMEGTFTIVEAGAAAAPAGEGEEAPAEEATAEETTGAAEGSGSAGEAIMIEAHDDFSFSPSEVDVAPGQTVTLTNMGFAQHDLFVDEWDAGTELLNNGQSGDLVIPEDAEVGAQFVFYCTVVGHRQSGMEGTFTIVEAGAAAAPAGEGEGEATAETEGEETTAATAEASDVDVAALTADNNPQAVTVVGTQWQYEPAEFEIAPGGVITFQNETGMMMGMSSDAWDDGSIPMIRSVGDGSTGEFTVPADAEVGSTIEFKSNLTEAEGQGMVGTITIVEGDGTAAASPQASPAATSGDAIEVKMLDSFAYEPAEFEAAVGATIHFVNDGFLEHDAFFEDWGEHPQTPMLKNGETADVVVPDDAEVGQQYEFYCTVPGHLQSGMKATVTIV